jgi:hypothetical protein
MESSSVGSCPSVDETAELDPPFLLTNLFSCSFPSFAFSPYEEEQTRNAACAQGIVLSFGSLSPFLRVPLEGCTQHLFRWLQKFLAVSHYLFRLTLLTCKTLRGQNQHVPMFRYASDVSLPLVQVTHDMSLPLSHYYVSRLSVIVPPL